MPDPLHIYNVEIKDARTAHRKARQHAYDHYEQALAVIASQLQRELYNCARQYRNATAAAEDRYTLAQSYTRDQEPPF